MKTCCGYMLSLGLVLIYSCSGIQPQPVAAPQAEVSALPADAGWWYARFRIEDKPEESPKWHIDSLIAGEIVTPVFEKHFSDIQIWRIHRRAAKDYFGHVFSFIFYAKAHSAHAIYEDIQANPVLKQLQSQGLLSETLFDDPKSISRPDIEDTSDEHWPILIQQTWPALIMGASRMWLDLVGVLAETHANEPDLVRRYLLVEQDIDRLWAENGQHSVLHHIAALFAYQPLLIRY